ELQAILKAFGSGDPVSLPPLNIEYFDFAQWQRKKMMSHEMGPALSFWRKKLGDIPDRPTLSFYRSENPDAGARSLLIQKKLLSTETSALLPLLEASGGSKFA